ncbi:MAG: hypothetical protein ACRYF0_18970 [Janthinobacterium lividum]
MSLLSLMVLALGVSALQSPTPFALTEWRGIFLCTAMMGWFCWIFTSTAVTDYDLDYLYLFTKNGTVQIPLGHFYKLRSGRNTWYLHYQDEQNRKQQLMIVPIRAAFS